MVVLPIASILVESSFAGATLSAGLVEKWFVFWAVGVRLFLAGLRQITQPRYTAESILGLKTEESYFLVRELGFANAAIGAAGIASLAVSAWILPIAIVGTIFYGLAGTNHVMHGERNKFQSVAMVSDLFIAVVLLTFGAIAMRHWP
jgi:hypothetical protein